MAKALLDQSYKDLAARADRMRLDATTLATASGLSATEVRAALNGNGPFPLVLRIFIHLFDRCGPRTRTQIVATAMHRAAETDFEIWREIPGCERYEVSNLGHVRRALVPGTERPGPILKPTRARDGHLKVSVYLDDGRQWRASVHRLVALAFLGPPPSPNHMVCHRNGWAEDCRALNLRWGTAKDNGEDMSRHLREGKFAENPWNSDPYARKMFKIFDPSIT